MIKLVQTDDMEEILVCPYCMDEKSVNDSGCCGESSAHFQPAYLIGDDCYLECDIEWVNK